MVIISHFLSPFSLSGGWGTWRTLWLCGHELANSTVGILGLGRIGECITPRTSTRKLVLVPTLPPPPSPSSPLSVAGVAIAERLAPFKVKKFIYSDVAPRPDLASLIKAEYGKEQIYAIDLQLHSGRGGWTNMLLRAPLSLRSVSFDELARESDFLAICCALTPETKEICNKNLFSKMKNTSIFINTSRYCPLRFSEK